MRLLQTAQHSAVQLAHQQTSGTVAVPPTFGSDPRLSPIGSSRRARSWSARPLQPGGCRREPGVQLPPQARDHREKPLCAVTAAIGPLAPAPVAEQLLQQLGQDAGEGAQTPAHADARWPLRLSLGESFQQARARSRVPTPVAAQPLQSEQLPSHHPQLSAWPQWLEVFSPRFPTARCPAEETLSVRRAFVSARLALPAAHHAGASLALRKQ
mmetsp:Transcript_134038/g.250799  ORF Transcript_134038/g.250799 Transcript_134038/m.250799 type:complete len:212 (-) Transcript_134038:1736-2371(-)